MKIFDKLLNNNIEMETNNICRCCGLQFTGLKELFTEYLEGDSVVLYSEILSDTFNISISHQITNTICLNCVKKLMDARDFKCLVLMTENMFHNTKSCMKTEESQIKAEENIKTEEDYPLTDDWCQNTEQEVAEDEFEVPLKKPSGVMNLRPSFTNKKKIKIKEKTKDTTADKEALLRDSSMKLIQNSNVCLFIGKQAKYKCFYCDKFYTTIAKLREHTSLHRDKTHKSDFIKNVRYFSIINADITNLKCNLCDDPFSSLEDLRTHLSASHAIKFDTCEHLLVPYKLTLTDEYKCVMCNGSFNTFHSLNIHMNSHSSANVCEVCGMSFWSRIRLRVHIYSQHRKHKCNFCSEMFNTASLKEKHLRRSHQKHVSKRICPECGKSFTYDHQLKDHRVKMHDLERKIYKCVECNKQFTLACNMFKHIRTVHRGEKKYSCDLCSMGFSTKTDKLRHETGHDNEKRFSCDYCTCKFKRKDSWKRHLKKQHQKEIDKVNNTEVNKI